MWKLSRRYFGLLQLWCSWLFLGNERGRARHVEQGDYDFAMAVFSMGVVVVIEIIGCVLLGYVL